MKTISIFLVAFSSASLFAIEAGSGHSLRFFQAAEDSLNLCPFGTNHATSAKGRIGTVVSRGAFEVDCIWRNGNPVSCKVRAHKGGHPEVTFAGKPFPFEIVRNSPNSVR